MRRKITLPDEITAYDGRQRELLSVIYMQGGATIREIYEALDDPPQSINGVRTLLNRLSKKGVVKKRKSGRHRQLLYVPALANAEVQLRALSRIAKLHFAGSRKNAIAALAKLAAQEVRRDIAA